MDTSSVKEIIATGTAWMEDHNYSEAITLLTAAYHANPDSDIEKALVHIRHRAIVNMTPEQPNKPWPGHYDDVFAGASGIPEINAADLTTEKLGAAILHQGSLIVRGLIPKDHASRLVSDIDHAFDGYDKAAALDDVDESLPWYSPFPAKGDYTWTETDRRWARVAGGVMAADSPRVLCNIIDLLKGTDLGNVLTGYLGEWPALTVKKCTLRRTPHDSKKGWHQDGSYLGLGVRTCNVWLSLSDCGVDAPGLEMVPKRQHSLFERGTEGAKYDWTVSPAMAGDDVTSPVFAPGDAMLFDQMLMHRTGVTPQMTKTRYAIESWFFAPSTLPHELIPIAF